MLLILMNLYAVAVEVLVATCDFRSLPMLSLVSPSPPDSTQIAKAECASIRAM